MMKLVVFSCLLAAASASAGPLGYTLGYIAPYDNGNYRGPLSLAPGQPANVIAADGRPLDTLAVNRDRYAHLMAKAWEGGVHRLGAVARRPLAKAPLLDHAAPITTAYAAPYAYLAYPCADHIVRYQ